MSISVFIPETKSISTPHTLPREFRPQHWYEANFDPHSKSKLILSAPQHENQIKFDPDSKPSHPRPPHKTKSTLIPNNEIKSTPTTQTEIKFISTTHTTSKSILMPTLEPCRFRAVLLLRVTHNSQCSWDAAALRIIYLQVPTHYFGRLHATVKPRKYCLLSISHILFFATC